MAIPGSNVLKTALSVIASQLVSYHQFVRRDENEIGQDVAVYAVARNIKGSFQPVSRNLYQQLGLDFNRLYYYFYTSKAVLDVQRDVSGDQISFDGFRYQVLSANDWFSVDGWTAVLCVRVGEHQNAG